MEHLMNMPSLPCFSCILHYPFGLSVSVFACPSVVCSKCISTIINSAIARCADTVEFKYLKHNFLILYWLDVNININYNAPVFLRGQLPL